MTQEASSRQKVAEGKSGEAVFFELALAADLFRPMYDAPEFGVNTPWQAFVQVRQRIYEAMLDDPELLPDVVAHVMAHQQRNKTKS